MNNIEIIERFERVSINGVRPTQQVLSTLSQIDRFDYDDFIKWLMKKNSVVTGGLLMEYLNR